MVYHNDTLDINYYTVDETPMLFGKMKLEWFGKHYKYADVSASFDIESTNLIDGDKTAIMYIWQFGITNDASNETYCIIGRTWDEFETLLNNLETSFKPTVKRKKAEYLFPIYVHNLSFEFTFIRPILQDKIKYIFGVKSQTVLFFRTDFIEFRCSMLLSGVPLKDLPTVKYHKAVGDLDYNVIRHSQTPLTDVEMSYCLLDVLVLCEYISIKRVQEGNINKIPYTKTGYPRRGVRLACLGSDYKDPKRRYYINSIQSLKFRSFKEYLIQNAAYMGGHTACNPWYNGKIVKNVTCYDFTSSYPAVMVCSNRFPTKFFAYEHHMSEKHYQRKLSEGFAMVGIVTFTNLESAVEYDSWISESKILNFQKNIDTRINNGKVFSHNGKITMFITEVDYEIFQHFYKWDKAEFECVYIYEHGYLPKPVIQYVLELYKAKTELKEVEGKELEYQLAKEILNSVYGMSVTDPCKDDLKCELNGEWNVIEANEEQLKEKVELYNRGIDIGKNVMPYIWGVYVSALARYNLATGIKYAGDRGLWVYADTDSIYVKDADKIKDYIEKYNKSVKEEMEIMCSAHGFNVNIWKPKNKKGVEKPLGYWNFDGHYKMFKTLGAKRYIKVDDDGHFNITVAGLGKNDGATYMMKHWNNNVLAVFRNFKEGLKIPPEYTGKLTHTIIITERCGKVTDYMGKTIPYVAKGGTFLEPCGFEVTISDEYNDFLNLIRMKSIVEQRVWG